MPFTRIGNEALEWLRGNSQTRADCGKVRETRAELESPDRSPKSIPEIDPRSISDRRKLIRFRAGSPKIRKDVGRELG
jgi:hypothetical protein